MKKSKEGDYDELQAPSLWLLVAVEQDRTGEPSHNEKILSVYKSQKDCLTMINAHREKSQSSWGFEIGENWDFKILEVPREITFGVSLPSWKDEIKTMENAMLELMETISDTKEKN